jgi:hypothetical protein
VKKYYSELVSTHHTGSAVINTWLALFFLVHSPLLKIILKQNAVIGKQHICKLSERFLIEFEYC